MSRSYHVGSDVAKEVSSDVDMAVEVPAIQVAVAAQPYMWLPTKRIRGEQPSDSILWRRTQPKPEVVQKYRCMYYKHHHSVAIKQRFFQKRQIGSTQLPWNMPKNQDINLAKGVMHRLHPAIESHTTFLLKIAGHLLHSWSYRLISSCEVWKSAAVMRGCLVTVRCPLFTPRMREVRSR
eukprot:5197873-Amphidinium_carterae.1